jgi:hypothetical protein
MTAGFPPSSVAASLRRGVFSDFTRRGSAPRPPNAPPYPPGALTPNLQFLPASQRSLFRASAISQHSPRNPRRELFHADAAGPVTVRDSVACYAGLFGWWRSPLPLNSSPNTSPLALIAPFVDRPPSPPRQIPSPVAAVYDRRISSRLAPLAFFCSRLAASRRLLRLHRATLSPPFLSRRVR